MLEMFRVAGDKELKRFMKARADNQNSYLEAQNMLQLASTMRKPISRDSCSLN